ncbi:DNA cytosine methyltransferase [Leuconostoc mesenteroides]|uniref:DNA cytosine methyltransferase n=5 Tax=Leuconostoc mesenteroides TaxID=1245 RepID=UPI0023608137|nr:DNA (cytosine-5-)-methyltransferase [Leuconostoc mesenteroides]
MKFLDLFSGIGGFRLGLERSGHTPVGYVEIDKFARQSYQAMYNTDGEWTAEDINKVTDEEWRKFNGTVELIAGGFPCQSFSIAGKREGFLNQTKGTLFFEVARAVKQIKPRFVFLENVKGLLNHDKGNTFRTILNTFDELGYDVEWRVLNSKDFGVPQNRERVYIIGHLRGDSGREVFPFFGEDGEINPTNVINLLKGKSDYGWHFEQEVHDENGLCRTVKANGGSGNIPKVILQNPAKVKQIGNMSSSNSFGGNPQTGRVYSDDGLSPTLNTMQGGGREPKVMVEKPHFGRLGKQAVETANNNKIEHGDCIEPYNKRVRSDKLSGTLTTRPEGLKTAMIPVVETEIGYRIRKLTPRECWRLQAFPDELFDKAQQAGLSDSQLYKQAGNSVTVNVIEYIGNLLKERE